MSKNNALARTKKRHALACVQANRIDEALDLYEKVCQRDPRDAEAWFMAGTLYGRLGQIAKAEAALRKAVDLLPNLAEGRLNLGQALELQGKFAEAEDHFRRAVELKPDLADGHDALGRLCQLRGDLRSAIGHHQRAIDLNPQRAASHLSLARALHQLGGLAAAADSIEQALRLYPDHAEAYYDLAGVRIAQGRYDDALRCIRQARQLKPGYVEAVAVEAQILDHREDYRGALNCIMPVLDRYREYPEVALVYAQLCHFSGDFSGAISRLEVLLNRVALSAERRGQVHFQLGELYDRRGEYTKAFANFKAGNDIKPVKFDHEEWERKITELITVFDRKAMLRAPRAGNGSERPVFIVGMPRSGTTLIEQILSAHPGVAAAGELADIGLLSGELHAALNDTVPANDITQLGRELCDALARHYLDMLDLRFPGAMRVTDKMPHNFLHLGTIALLFPLARVIHCVRDPLDTCLSCYFHDFTGDHPYAYDLADLGFYYRRYQRLMSHWRDTLDLPILELRYEDLVQDPRKWSRKLVEFCALEWDERCLEFYKSDHLAATASFQQVREPIHGGSVGRWRHYADYLEPLRLALAGEGI